MTPQERARLIDSYGRAHDLLTDTLAGIPRALWQERPAADQWTVHEILIHLADSEANSYVRARKLIAEPGSSVTTYDEPRWARALRYHDQDPDEALELFRLLRHRTSELIRPLPESVWSHTIQHPELGTLSLDEHLQRWVRHVPEHVQQIRALQAALPRS